MTNRRIQVYVDDEMKRRIELAAIRREQAVTQYCLEAIRQQLAEDDMLEIEQIEITIKPNRDDDRLIGDLRALREDILASRAGRPIDLDIIAQVREERDHELPSMR